MQIAEEWLKTWICLSFIFAWVRTARPRFDVSTDMGMVLVPADAEVDTTIFRLRATDQDADFPLVFEIIATTSPIVRVENLPCTLYNKVCQANVILTKRLQAGRLHDFVVRVRDSKGDVNSMQATISVTNATTPRDKIFPHLPSLIMVPEDTKPEKELDYLLVESNPWSGKPVYIELWQPKELFKIRQRQMGSRTKGIITLIGELDFETQSMYTLTMYATDPFTEPGKDTRNIAGLHIVVIVQDVQDVPPVFTLAPPLTKVNNTVKPGEVILRVHAEDGDKGVPREVTYGLISEGNPFTPFFNVSETTGEIVLAKPLEELTQITHVGAPIVLKIVAEEIRSSRDEPPAQATIVELGLLLGEPRNSPPYFENDNYAAWIDENAEPGTVIMFSDNYSTAVKDEDIGKAAVFSLTLENNNGTFEVNPAVAERVANFIIAVRDNSLIDYEKFKSLRFKIHAQEVGPATNLSASVPVTIFLRDLNDNPPVFDMHIYEVTLSENPNAGTRVVQVHATDEDTGSFGKIQYTKIIGDGSEAFEINPDTGVITISMGSVLDREQASRLELSVEAKDEEGKGNRGTSTLVVNVLDVNDNPPIFEKEAYEFLLNSELTNFTTPAIIKAFDADVEPPNNVIRYEIIHGNYDNKFQLNDESGELTLREAINNKRIRKTRQAEYSFPLNLRKQFRKSNIETLDEPTNTTDSANLTANSGTNESSYRDFHLINNLTDIDLDGQNQSRRRRAEDTPLFIITARAYDLGVPHLSSVTQIRIMRPMSELARIVTFVMPGENPDPAKTAETLATITGSRVVIQEIKPYIAQIELGSTSDIGKRSVVVARVEQGLPGTVVDVDKIREILAANGFGIISGMDNVGIDNLPRPTIDTIPTNTEGRTIVKNASIVASSINEEVVVYKTENKLLTWLLILLGLLLLAALITLVSCCICPSCPFYMEPKKRRIHSSETLVVRTDGRPKRHLHRKPIKVIDGHNGGRKEAWSADPEGQQWQFNRRNTKNPGIASLPGDIGPHHQQQHDYDDGHHRHPASLRGGDGVYGNNVIVSSLRGAEDERIYMEDVETQRHNYDQAEMDSLRRHELERGSDAALRDEALAAKQERFRESHFYRDGNAEVLRLITRGEIEDHKNFNREGNNIYHVNGKEILMQRFIEDQKLRRNQDVRDSYHEGYHDGELDRSMEFHRRANGPAEIIILPERLEIQQQPSYGLKQHQQDKVRLIAERNYKYQSFKEIDNDEYQRIRGMTRVTLRDADTLMAETSRSVENKSRHEPNPAYSIHDAELVRQNALLTRLLLEKEASHLNVPVIDSSSFLETQSLPGHAAIATQTDRTTSTQTEFFARSRSDNENSKEDPRARRKSKLKGKLETRENLKKTKTIWVTTPIPEESQVQSGTRKGEVIESRKTLISPDVLKEISNSLKSDEFDGYENEDDEVSGQKAAASKSDKIQKAHKIMSKTVCTSKKKVSEARIDDNSTTSSPEMKDKKVLGKSKARKKPEKPPRAKKPEKSNEAEKNHFMEPSFRVLEREISSIHHKIRQFGDKKLKIKKDESSKKESEDDSGATYDVSKKLEMTIKKTKKSISRETSPIKISKDEQKTKTSEEEVFIEEMKATKQAHQTTSSSDLEDFNNSNGQLSNCNGRNVQYEVSKLQTRNRFELRRQTHLENSNSEKNCKSEEREKYKFSSSSPDRKIDTNLSTSKDNSKHKKQLVSENLKRPSEKKSLVSQKVIKRPFRANGTTEPKKMPPVKSKTEEEKRFSRRDQHLLEKAKSLIGMATKSPTNSPSRSKDSVQYEKLTSSVGDESQWKSQESRTREMVSLDLDKLAQNVRGVVEKEILSLTQAAKKALINKSDEVIEDKKDVKLASSTKPKKVQPMIDNKNQSTIEKYRMTRSIENTEKKDYTKQQKSKTKSADRASPVKSDDAISFIVIENNKTALSAADHSKKYEERDKITKKLEKCKAIYISDDERKKSDARSSSRETNINTMDTRLKETFEKLSSDKKSSFDMISDFKKSVSEDIGDMEKSIFDAVCVVEKSTSDKIDDIRTMIDNNICEAEKIISDEIKETEKVVSGKIGETKQSLSSEIDETKKFLADEIDETKKSMSDKIDVTKRSLSSDIHETKKNIGDKLNEAKKSLSNEIDETKRMLSDKIEKTEMVIADTFKETKGSIANKVNENENVIMKIDETKVIGASVSGDTDKFIAEEINDTKTTNIDEITELRKIVDDKIDESKKIVDNNFDESRKVLDDKSDESKKIVDNNFDESRKVVDDNIGESKKIVDNNFDESRKVVDDKSDESNKIVDNNFDESRKVVDDKSDESKKIINNKIDENKKLIDEKIDESKTTVVSASNETKKFIDEKIDDSKIIADSVGDETKKLITDKNETKLQMEAQTGRFYEDKDELVLSELAKSDDINVCPSKEGEIVFTYSIGRSNDLLKSANNDKEYAEIEPKSASTLRSDALKFMSKCLPRKLRDNKSTSEEIVDASKERETRIVSETSGESTRYREQVREKESINIIRSSSRVVDATEITHSQQTNETKTKREEHTEIASRPAEEEQTNETHRNLSAAPIETTAGAFQQGGDKHPDQMSFVSSKIEETKATAFLCEPPKKPIFEITNAIGDDEEVDGSEDDSSTASDVSNKTALQTIPYDTPPRLSVSSDGGDSEDTNKSNGKTRQKWSSSHSKGGFLTEEPSKSSKSPVFPEKIEIAPIDEGSSRRFEQLREKKSSRDGINTLTASSKFTEYSESRAKTKPVVVAMKRKEHLKTEHSSIHQSESRKTSSPRREKIEERTKTVNSTSEQRNVEIRSKNLKLQVSHHSKQPRDKSPSKAPSKEPSPMRELKEDTSTSASSPRVIDYGRDPEIANARSRYMAWYEQKRADMGRKRRERKEADEEQGKKGVGKKMTGKTRKTKTSEDGDKVENEAKGSKGGIKSSGGPTISRLRIRPLVNVESEQLKAIVRQGRKLRKAEGDHLQDPPVQIFVPEKPSRDPLAHVLQVEPRHHLTQHSEYKYEKALLPMPFYLHPPPPPPHPSPEHFQDDLSESRHLDDDLDSGIAVSMQGGTRLRHQQLLEKKTVFDIAYSEAAPTQLRSDSSTPPS